MSKRWTVLVIWNDGREEYLKAGWGDMTAVFPSPLRAQEQANFLRKGIAGDVQSINVVPILVPATSRRRIASMPEQSHAD